MAKACEYYPDLFAPYPQYASKKDKEKIDDDNKSRVQFYRAVRYLLMARFSFPDVIPEPPHVPPRAGETDDLLHDLTEDRKAYFLAVAGNLLATARKYAFLSSVRSCSRSSEIGRASCRERV